MKPLSIIAEGVAKRLRICQQQPKIGRLAYGRNFVDIGHMPITKYKAYGPGQRKHSPGETDTMVVHVTGVRGGFGVAKYQERAFISDPDPVLDSMGYDAYHQALFQRYRDTPYHYIVTQCGTLVKNRPLSQWSWHANGGNYGVGIAFDCDWNEQLSSGEVDAFRNAFAIALDIFSSWTGPGVKIKVASHRQFSKNRAMDPGPQIWQNVVLPEVLGGRFSKIKLDWETTKGTGLPIPNRGSW